MTTHLFKCLTMNWVSGMYDWVTFAARDEAEARRRAERTPGCLPESLSPAQEMYPAAA